MDYKEVISRLNMLGEHRIALGLERVKSIWERMGGEFNPTPIIIAGTNGKGSVAAMLSSILIKAGYKVGMYTSPHILDIRERIVINNRVISRKEFADVGSHVLSFVEGTGTNLTYFEVLTMMAFAHFQQKSTDFAVIEVGMGGRLDATNIITPKIACITDIGIDHTEFLGKSIREIALEKAGVIKSKFTDVVCSASGEGAEVVRARAEQVGTRSWLLGRNFKFERVSWDRVFGERFRITTDVNEYNIQCPLRGKHQGRNASAAIKCAEILSENFSISREDIISGIKATNWPGRFQTLIQKPPVLLDVAHNSDSMAAFVDTLRDYFKSLRCVLVFGVMKDKDVNAMLTTLKRLRIAHIYAVEADSPRAMSRDKICSLCSKLGIKCFTKKSVKDAVNDALMWAIENNGMVAVVGSHYIVGDAFRALGVVRVIPQTSWTYGY
ncbi:MAG: hypothetical protein DRN20_05200 [Thermoplasmata archaeon]|nr:MAG: hypothetical protein DRN20_05200 [Thermoplasmata archaeon]